MVKTLVVISSALAMSKSVPPPPRVDIRPNTCVAFCAFHFAFREGDALFGSIFTRIACSSQS